MFENISLGNKVELSRRINFTGEELGSENNYLSKVLDIKDDEIVCLMPFNEGKLVALRVGAELEAFFYTVSGIYKALCQITKRDKDNNIYTINIKPLSSLVKFQRREYFRLECSKECRMTVFTDEEKDFFFKNSKPSKSLLKQDLKAIIIDISGGGVRVFSHKQFNIADYCLINFELNISGKTNRYNLVGKIIMSNESPNLSDIYDTRIEFKRIAESDRQDIIKYIFEQQRRLRKSERG